LALRPGDLGYGCREHHQQGGVDQRHPARRDAAHAQGHDQLVVGNPQSRQRGRNPAMATPTPPNPDGSSAQQRTFDEEPPMIIDTNKRYVATMNTSHGTMVFNLDPLAAPKTVNSFVFLARYHYFDGIVFHRIIPGFVLQGGDPTGKGTGGPGYKFADELPSAGRYEIGSLAMANAGPNTNGSQFFVISGPSGVSLPPQSSLFGKVVKGLDVVAAIDSIGTRDGTPKETVTIESVTITESD